MAWLETGTSGNYIIRWRENGRVKSRSTGTKSLAKAERQLDKHHKLDGAIREGYIEPKPIVDIKEASEQWIAAKEIDITAGSLKRYKDAMSLFLKFCDSGGLAFLEDLIPLDLRSDYIKWLSKKGYAPNTINASHDAVKTFLFYCFEKGWLAKNPLKSGRRIRADDPEPKHFNNEQLKRIKPILNKDKRFNGWFRDYYLMYQLTGARRAELFHIKPEHVDLKNGKIEILNSKTHHRREYRKDKYRVLDIHPLLIPILKSRMNKEGLPLFPKIKGENVYNVTLQELCEAAKVPYLPCHCAGRHTFGYLALQAGASILELKEMMGHSSVIITEKYSHLEPKKTKQAIKDIKI